MAATVDEILAERFRIDRPPTLVAGRPGAQLAFSHMSNTRASRGRSLPIPPEVACAFHVPLTLPFFSDLWISGKRRPMPIEGLGDALLFDLHDNPVVGLDTPFDSFRFYVPQAALDNMAAEEGLPRIPGLHARQLGQRDPILYGLAQVLADVMARPGDGSAMFCEHIALAFFAYIYRTYGGLPIRRNTLGGLASWQLQRAYEFMDAHLGADPSIADVADQCGLSTSYFSRAFKREAGITPHRWLMMRRVARAKELLREADQPLAQIAQTCGFVDQSHFTRVFSKIEGCSPGRWRRLNLR